MYRFIVTVFTILAIAATHNINAHQGNTDSNNCHRVSSTGSRHCHPTGNGSDITTYYHQDYVVEIGNRPQSKLYVDGLQIDTLYTYNEDRACESPISASWSDVDGVSRLYFRDKDNWVCRLDPGKEICITASEQNKYFGYYVNFPQFINDGYYVLEDFDNAVFVNDVCLTDNRAGQEFSDGITRWSLTSSLPEPENIPNDQGGVCEDTPPLNDGWGWDGVGSCRVEPSVLICVDSPPVGDGWGWNGISSCEVEL